MNGNWGLRPLPLRTASIAAVLALWATCVSAQPVAMSEPFPDDYHVAGIRRHLADQFQADVDRLRLNLPVLVDVQLGEIIALDEKGNVETIDRVPESLFTATERPPLEFSASDGIPLRDGNIVWPRLFAPFPPTRSMGVVQISLNQIQEFVLAERNARQFQQALLRSQRAIAAQRRGKSLWLVTHVYRGPIEMRLVGPPDEARIQPRMSGWKVTSPVEGTQWEFVSRGPKTLAFQGDKLEYQLDPDPGAPAADVQRQPAIVTPENAPVWERSRFLAAAANGHPESAKDDDGNKVTVLFATSRQVQTTPPTWREFFAGFVYTTNGWITIVVLATLGILVLLGLGFAKRLSLASLTIVVASCLALYLLAAAIDSSRRFDLARRPGGQFTGQLGPLRYGVAQVSVPDNHKRGSLETPFSLYIIRMPEDPDQHFVITKADENRAEFFRLLKEKVSQSPKKNAFVFVHGYNVLFEDAVKRTAQLWVDLEFEGAPLCYAWPSQGELIHYVRDANTSRSAATRLKEFLEQLQAESGASEIHLIAHSMGNAVLTGALTQLGREQLSEEKCLFREVLLTAPDIDAQLFEEEIVPAIANPRQRITLYASSNDKALKRSADLAASRAGMAGEFLLVMDGIETVDVSELDTDFLGHSYYGDHRLVVDDMRLVVLSHLSPKDRGLKEAKKKDLVYWRFVP